MSTKKVQPKKLRKLIFGEKMSPEAHLVRTAWFRAAITGPIAIAAFVAWIFTFESELYWKLSPDGMNLFLDLFKLPIGIASLALPIAAVVAANHRSMQTAKQIKEQNSQNVFSNHLEHRRFFGTFIEEMKPFGEQKVEVAALYEDIFREAVEGDLKPNIEFLEEILKSASKTIIYANELSDFNFSEKKFTITYEELSKLSDLITETDSFISSILRPWDNTNIPTNICETPELIQEIAFKFRKASWGLEKCANFHRNYYKSKYLNIIFRNSIDIEIRHRKISHTYVLYKDLINITKEYLADSGSLKNTNHNSIEGFQNRLKQLDNTMNTATRNIYTMDTIINNHLPPNHALEVLRHAPERWKDEISLP